MRRQGYDSGLQFWVKVQISMKAWWPYVQLPLVVATVLLLVASLVWICLERGRRSLALVALVSFGLILGLRMKPPKQFAQADTGAVPRVTAEQAFRLYNEERAVIVDVRGSPAFRTGHIAGALNIDFLHLREHQAELPRDRTIIAYCS